MLRYQHLLRTLPLGLAISTLAFHSGCIVVNSTETSSLHGTWELTDDQSSDLTQTFLTFDRNGQLTSVTYTIANVAATNSDIRGTSHVNGDNVTITTTFGLDRLDFIGTFNADKTVITGESGTSARLGGITVTVDNGPVTLTRQ